jgi:G:T-mismatch repair DNA endonuclease (very short patch repair protein)
MPQLDLIILSKTVCVVFISGILWFYPTISAIIKRISNINIAFYISLYTELHCIKKDDSL